MSPGAESVAHQPSSSGGQAADKLQETDAASALMPEVVKVESFARSTRQLLGRIAKHRLLHIWREESLNIFITPVM